MSIQARALLARPALLLLTPARPLSCCPALQATAVPTIANKKRSGIPNRHWNPAFRKQRAWKVMKVPMPDFDFDRKRAREEVTPEEVKEKMKKQGIQPMHSYQERPSYVSSVGAVFDPYLPPEGEGKASMMGGELKGVGGQVYDKTKSKGRTMMAVRKIRSYEGDFDPTMWVEEAMEVYKAAHIALAEGDEEKMHKFVTEKAFPEMMNMARRKTIRWTFVKSLEPPRVVHVRTGEIMSKVNYFGQVTVRLHTQQTLAVYDRFGRLIHGSETVAKDVLEFVVFEKHLSNTYGQWRLHAKILPEWLPAREPGRLTYRVPRPAAGQEEAPGGEAEQEEGYHEEGTMLDRFGRKLKEFGK